MIEHALEKLSLALEANTAATLLLLELRNEPTKGATQAAEAATEPEADEVPEEKPKATRAKAPKAVAPEPEPEVETPAAVEPEPEVQAPVEGLPKVITREELIAKITETVKQKIIGAKNSSAIKAQWTAARESFNVEKIGDIEDLDQLVNALAKAEALSDA